MSLSIVTLGTASQAPTKSRALNSVVVRFEKGSYLIDCGEGTQVQLGASSVRHSSITKVLITHLHGDHCFGLPGMLCLLSSSHAPDNEELKSVSKKQKTEIIIDIYGPLGLARYLRTAMCLSRSLLSVKFRVNELVPTERQINSSTPSFSSWNPPAEADHIELHPCELKGTRIEPMQMEIENEKWNCWHLFKDESVTCIATELLHHVPTFGYIFEEPERQGLLDKEKLKTFGLLKTPLCGKLSRGESVTHNGILVNPGDVMKPVQPGRKVAVLGDCNDSSLSVGPCLDSSVVLHESTLENKQYQLAQDHGHSTPKLAVDFAHKCRAKQLILNHFSQRYKKQSDIDPNDKKSAEIQTDKILLTEGKERARELGKREDYVDIAEDLKIFHVKHVR